MKTNIAILYTDGSFLPSDPSCQEGFYGSAVHGYIFNDEVEYKNNSDKEDGFQITAIGYIRDTDYKNYETPPKLVKPIMYLDGAYSYLNKGTVNTAELLAIIDTLNNVKDIVKDDVKLLIIYTDSGYALTVINAIRNKDKKEWDNELTPNVVYYRLLEKVLKEIEALDVKVEFNKIKAHVGELGNEVADTLAKFASRQSAHRETKHYFHVTDATKRKYWVKTDKQHPLLNYKQLFFTNTLRADSKEIIYSILDYKSDTQPGEKTAKAGFGLVILKEPPSIIEDVIKLYHKHMWHNRYIGAVSTINLTTLYARDTTFYNSVLGKDSFIFNNKGNTLQSLTKEDIVYTIRPAGLAIQALDRMQYLYGLVSKYRLEKELDSIDTNMFVDITKDIYNIKEDPKKGTIYETIVPNGTQILNINIKIANEKVKIPLDLGKDTITRNQFKAIEKQNPKIILVLEGKSKEIYQYYTIIDIDDGIGIYCNFYSGKIYK